MIEWLSHYGFLSQQNLPFPIYYMLSYMKVITVNGLWIPLTTLGGTKCCIPKCSSTWKLVSKSVVVQPLSRVQLCDHMNCSTRGFLVLHCLLECSQTRVHWVSDAIQPSHPLSPTSLALNLSSELALHIRWPKYWSFSFSISPSNGYSGLISFRIDWFDLLADQGTLGSLLQHHSSKASILQHSAFFMVQLSHPYMSTRKTRALTRQTFVSLDRP